MFTISTIFFYSLIFLLSFGGLVLYKKIIFSKLEFGALFGSAAALTALSFFIYKERIGGTIMHWAHGWPHFFANYQIKDILDNVIINKWHFTPGGMYSYIIADWVFYFSVLLFLYILFKIIIKKNI